jgi:hypothetical protein
MTEHKYEHEAKSIFYIKKGTYSLLTPNNKIIHKARGMKLDENVKNLYKDNVEAILLKKIEKKITRKRTKSKD